MLEVPGVGSSTGSPSGRRRSAVGGRQSAGVKVTPRRLSKVVVRNFRDLRVYEQSCALADALRAATEAWDPLDRWSVGIQMIRAADSVGANLAEGWGRDTRRDRKRFVFLARGSACEVEHWVERAQARRLLLPDGAAQRSVEVSRMLNGLLRAWS